MTPANNIHHLAAAAARRTAVTRQRAENALLALRTSSQPVTVAKLAKDAGISRSWLYTQSDLIAAVRQLDGQARAPRSTPATERSLQVRLAAALARNQRIQQRLDTLTEQKQAATPTTRTRLRRNPTSPSVDFVELTRAHGIARHQLSGR